MQHCTVAQLCEQYICNELQDKGQHVSTLFPTTRMDMLIFRTTWYRLQDVWEQAASRKVLSNLWRAGFPQQDKNTGNGANGEQSRTLTGDGSPKPDRRHITDESIHLHGLILTEGVGRLGNRTPGCIGQPRLPILWQTEPTSTAVTVNQLSLNCWTLLFPKRDTVLFQLTSP